MRWPRCSTRRAGHGPAHPPAHGTTAAARSRCGVRWRGWRPGGHRAGAAGRRSIEAQAAAKRRGTRLGRPAAAATRAAAERAEQLAADGLGQRAIADRLNAEGWPRATAAGAAWNAMAVNRALRTLRLDREAAAAHAQHTRHP